MTRERPSFFSGPALTVMTVLLCLALYVLYPRQAMFEDTNNLDNPDALSLAYLEVLLRSDPDNTSLRINLARMQASVDQSEKALATLTPLITKDRVPSRAKELQLKLLVRALAAAQKNSDKEALRAQLAGETRAVLKQPYSFGRKLALIKQTQASLNPEQLIEVLQPLMSQASGAPRLKIAQRLAKAQEASGAPQAAAETLGSVTSLVTAGSVNRPDPEHFFDELIRLELASNRPRSALQRFKAHRLDTASPDSLRRGIRLAALAGDSSLQKQWLEQLANLEPGNLDVQRDLISLQLGSGDLVGALATAKLMQNAPAGHLNPTDRRRIAQVLQWNDRASDALSVWLHLYRHQGSTEALTRATNLAFGLFQWRTLEELLSLAAARNQLDADGYVLLAESRIRLGALKTARASLQEGNQRFPNSDTLRMRLLEFYLNGRQYTDAIALLQSLKTLSEQERLQLANLHWRTRDPQAALEVLEADFSNPELADEAADMRLDLAILLGRDEPLRSEYQRLLQQPPASLTSATRERLLTLAVALEDLPTALDISQRQFQATGNSRYLEATAEYQLGLGRWPSLIATLERWRSQFPEADENPRFWTLEALVAQQRQRPQEAETAFRRAWTLAPENPEVLRSWSWFLIAHPERLPGHLPHLLERLSRSNQQDSYPVLAYGYKALGDSRRALNWFRQGTAAGQDSTEWLTSYASLLESAGAEATAFRVRQQLLANTGKPMDARTPPHRRPDPDPSAGNIQTPLYQFNNRAAQIGMNWTNLGRFSLRSKYINAQSSHDSYRWRARLSRPEIHGSGLFKTEPTPSTDALLELQNNATNILWTATLGRNDRLGDNDLQASLALTVRPSDNWSVTAGHTKGERARDSAEAWWLAARDSSYMSVRYTPFQRLELAAEIADLDFAGPERDSLAHGVNIDAAANYSVFRNDPAWTLSLGYQNQQLSTLSALDATSFQALTEPAQTGDILSRDFERIGLYSRWTHGEPHALYRTSPSPKWFFGLGAGYVLSTSTPDLGAEVGLGWRLTGDDELALSAGWTSDGVSGDSRFNLNFTYTLFLNEQ